MSSNDRDMADYVIGDDAEIEEVDNLDERDIYVDGEHLTEARLAELNAAAEQEAEQRRRGGLVPGGKSLSGDGSHSPIVQTRVAKTTKQHLEEIAKSHGMGVSKFVRPAVEDQVAYFVLWEQSFDGAAYEWVRLNKALPLSEAETTFEHFRQLAATHGYRRVQIRRGRDLVVKQWPNAA